MGDRSAGRVNTEMRFAVLGPVEVTVDGRALSIGGPQQRALLAALLLDAGRVVSVDRLVECLWGDRPPAAARTLLQGCVAGLRRALGSGRTLDPGRRLVTRAPGYRLDVHPGELDLDRFEQLVAEADRAAADGRRAAHERSAALFGEALAVWRGPALDGLTSGTCQADVVRLTERRLEVLERRVDIDLRLGRHAALVAELESLVRAHPLRERLWGQLMLALHGADRQADALAAYRRSRQILVDQLGVEPGARLRRLHAAILSGAGPDEIEAEPERAVTVAPAAAPAPAQLPATVPTFVGRAGELGRLDSLIAAGSAAGGASAVVVSAVAGTAGVGKTALAVRWAHRVAGRFPGGQLYVNLRGFDPVRQPMDPAEAVRGFLDALGVPVARIPAGLDAQVGLYRSVLAGRRVLVVLDNARDAEQVRPLLPGAPGSLALVTSRDRLTPLVATDGARPLMLDLLTEHEARDLLSRRLGPDRTAAEPDAVTDIIGRCAGLPLALAIVAARLETSPGLALTDLADQLRDTTGALDALHAGDPATDVRAVFSWSVRAVSADAARLFRLLGLHPGPDLTAPAAASLAGIPADRSRTLLAELVRAHLLTEHVPGRYACHDLLRAYAAELARRAEHDEDRQAATHRMLDHYLHSAQAAADVLFGPWNRYPAGSARPGTVPERPVTEPAALGWLTAERDVLVAAVECAAATGFEGHAWRLVRVLGSYFQQRCLWNGWVATQRVALAAAQRTGDLAGQAHAHYGLGTVLTHMGRYAEAHAHLNESLDRFGGFDDPTACGRVRLTLAMLCERQGAYDTAVGHAELSLTLFRTAGYRPGVATALNGIGWLHTQQGRPRRALAVCRQALEIYQADADRPGQAAAWDSLGSAHHRLAEHHQALACHARARDLNRELGDRYHEAETLLHLGDVHQSVGDRDASRHAWQQALDILDELRHPAADKARTRLGAHPVTSGESAAAKPCAGNAEDHQREQARPVNRSGLLT
jgi:DNA-binding SARP family transcriptional activator/tetratricopeptide (TPR) repeat protein